VPKTILLADDSITIRKVVELAFHDTEIRVDAVGSGSEALARLEASQPDLVLADVVMPSPDGYELCRAVKESARPVPVLLLAGSFEPFDADRAAECGADGHVRKPFESRVLLERVRELVHHPPKPPAPEPVSIDTVRNDLAESLPIAEGEPADDPVVAVTGAASASEQRGAVEHGKASDAFDLLLEEPAAGAARAPAQRAAGLHVAGIRLAPEDIEAISRAVVARLSEGVLREIAWEVVPDLAESIVRERIRQLEREDRDRS
jgi:CheY-like chemotaxis protein